MRKGSKLANKNSLSFLNSQRCNHGAFLDWTNFLCIILQRTSQIYHLDNVLLISFFLPFPSCYSNIFFKYPWFLTIYTHLTLLIHSPHLLSPFTIPPFAPNSPFSNKQANTSTNSHYTTPLHIRPQLVSLSLPFSSKRVIFLLSMQLRFWDRQQFPSIHHAQHPSLTRNAAL